MVNRIKREREKRDGGQRRTIKSLVFDHHDNDCEICDHTYF